MEIYSAIKVEQIKDHLFIDKSNNITIGVNDMTVNDKAKCVRLKDEAWSKPEIDLSVQR